MNNVNDFSYYTRNLPTWVGIGDFGSIYRQSPSVSKSLSLKVFQNMPHGCAPCQKVPMVI